MTRLSIVAVLAAAILGGCTTMTPEPQPIAVQPNVMAYQPGTGVVQRVFPAPGQPLQRLEVRMDNGTVQYVDTEARDFQRGMRIALSEDRLITPR